MFFIRDRPIIISLACLPLHKEQNQSCAPNAPSPFDQKTTFFPPSALSSQLGFPPPWSCPQLQNFLPAQIVPDLPPLEAARLHFSAFNWLCHTAMRCRGLHRHAPELGQCSPQTISCHLCCGEVPRTRHARRPQEFGPVGFAILCSWGIRGFY